MFGISSRFLLLVLIASHQEQASQSRTEMQTGQVSGHKYRGAHISRLLQNSCGGAPWQFQAKWAPMDPSQLAEILAMSSPVWVTTMRLTRRVAHTPYRSVVLSRRVQALSTDSLTDVYEGLTYASNGPGAKGSGRAFMPGLQALQ